MRELAFVLPGRLTARSGGSIYDRRIVAGLKVAGHEVAVHELDAGFPFPTPAALTEAASVLAGIADRSTVVIDGLALGAMPEIAASQAPRLAIVGLVHHPLSLETGLTPRLAAVLRESEVRALRSARRVIVTSATTAAALADFEVAPARISVVEPGVDSVPLAHGSSDDTPNLLCVASLTARKGHQVLLEALARLRHLPWQLVCVGSMARDPDTVQLFRQRLAQLELESRVELMGEVDDAELARQYARADMFVLASHYEGYGMVFDEALAHGLPVVATAGGAIAQTVPPDAGIIVPLNDSVAFAEALARLIGNRDLQQRMRRAAVAAASRRRSWQQASHEFAAAIADVSIDSIELPAPRA